MGQTHGFLEAVHGAAADLGLCLCVWEASSKSARFFASVDEAADYALGLGKVDAYTGVGGFRVPPARGRGKAEDVAYVAGVFLDIDVLGGSHADAKKPLPADFDEAQALVEAMGPPPSILVRTGHGLHAWWLFDEPWVFESDADKARCRALVKGWVDTGRAVAQEKGRDIDPIGDISRVLRIPGTIHTQSGLVVEMLSLSDARYSPDDLSEYCIRPEFLPRAITTQKPVVNVSPLSLRADIAVPEKVRLLAEADDAFHRTWERKRRDIADQSASGYDLAIANEGVYRGWTDQEIADAILAHRVKHGDKPQKGCRRDYLIRTIARARESIASRSAEALPPDGVAATDADKKLAMEGLKATFGARFAGMNRVMADPPLYSLLFTNPDEEVFIGDNGKMTQAQHVKKTLYGMQTPVSVGKVRDWGDVLKRLSLIRRDVEDPMGSIEAQTLEMIRAYITSYRPSDDMDFERNRPFVKDGMLYVYAQDVVRWLQNVQNLNCTVNEFRHRYLAKAGFVSTQIRDAAETKRCYWKILLDKIERAEDMMERK